MTHLGRHSSQLGPVTPGRHWHDPDTGSQVTAPSLIHWHAVTMTTHSGSDEYSYSHTSQSLTIYTIQGGPTKLSYFVRRLRSDWFAWSWQLQEWKLPGEHGTQLAGHTQQTSNLAPCCHLVITEPVPSIPRCHDKVTNSWQTLIERNIATSMKHTQCTTDNRTRQQAS